MSHEKENIRKKLEPIAPELAEYTDTLMEMLHCESGQVVAIFSTSVFEERLARAIELRFVKMLRKISDLIFRTLNAPLSTLSAKINVAYAIGLLDKDQYHDADLIRRIRNKFAHSTKPIDFDAPEIIRLVDQLRRPDELREAIKFYKDSIGDKEPVAPLKSRMKFFMATSTLSGFFCISMDNNQIKRLSFAHGPYADQEKPSTDKL